MSEYEPHNWVILKIDSEEYGVYFKVLGGWSGGYLDGDSWRINSGIAKIEEEDEHYLFHGLTGSVYKCLKRNESLRFSMQGTYNTMKKEFGDKVNIVPVEEVIKILGSIV